MVEPGIRFLIGGVQKAGTTALALYLAAHPGLALPLDKEAHVFDDPDFNEAWSPSQIDTWAADKWSPAAEGRLRGDATPLTIAHPHLIQRVARYNPAMRWVVLLRDPVERAVSHYYMIRGWGHEPRGLLWAVLAEPARLWRGRGDWSWRAPARYSSYVSRGRYARQLDVLFQHFPRDQVLLLRSHDLAEQSQQTVSTVLDFLGVPPFTAPPGFSRAFEGSYRPLAWWSPGRWLLKLLLRGEKQALKRRHGVDLD